MKYSGFYKKAQRALIDTFNSMYASGNPQAADYFRYLFTTVEEEKILREPVFQSVFPWETTDKTFGDMDSLLGYDFVNAIATAKFKDPANPGIVEQMGFGGGKGRDSKPFKHQITAWEAVLKRNKSIVITTGTGSGKTESFMIPILKQLYDDRCNSNGVNPGVEAIFLYPLNALIASQRKRIHAWCSALPTQVTYGIYTGEANEEQRHANNYLPQIIDRIGIRSTPPQILFSNPTMLEYMMVRAKDQTIIQHSKNLKWIVLDEAHTYTGSAATELAMQIRRLLKLFGKKPDEVNFAIASATIGSDMKDFLEQLTGKNYTDFEFIEGKRIIPDLNPESAQKRINQINQKFGVNITCPQIYNLRTTLNKSESMTSVERALSNSNQKEKKALSAYEICSSLGISDFSLEKQLDLIDALSEQDSVENKDSNIDTAKALLPVRAHFFIRAIKGVYAFQNQKEDENIQPLPIGHLTTLETPSTRVGDSMMLQVLRCKRCGEYLLEGNTYNTTGFPSTNKFCPIDHFFQFESLVDDSDVDDDDDEDTTNTTNNNLTNPLNPFAIAACTASSPSSRFKIYYVDLDFETGDFIEGQGSYVACNNNQNQPCCPSCGSSKKNWSYITFTANLISRVLAHILLEEAPIDTNPNHTQKLFDGRKLITFTDNRNRTASFAKGLNTGIEMEWCRSAIYNDLHDKYTMQGQLNRYEQIALQSLEKDKIEKGGLDQEDEKTLKELKEKSRAKVQCNPMTWGNFKDDFKDSIDLKKLKETIGSKRLQNNATINDYLQAIFFDAMAMRPLYANSLETLGLVRFEYPDIENLRETDVPLDFENYFSYTQMEKEKKLQLQDWKNLLRIVLDYEIRRNTHIIIPSDIRNIITQRYFSDSIYSSSIHGIKNPNTGRLYKTFPQIRNYGHGEKPQIGRLPLLLLFAKGIYDEVQLTNTLVQETNNLLNTIWMELIKMGLLQDSHDDANIGNNSIAHGYKIDLFSGVHCPTMSLIKKINECPVSHYFIDCDFRGISPTVVGELSKKNYLRYKLNKPYIEIPHNPIYPEKYNDEKQRIEAFNNWFDNVYLKVLGNTSSGLNIRYNIMLKRPIFVTQEHSAQISSVELRESEKKFEEGKLNILSCSTTMEMGVDIGGISIIQMNNIPPKPSNYLQRTGRAGRRTETQSLAVTICNDDPIGHLAIDNPMWPFDHEIAAPSMNLSSSTIIQRHANSLLLGEYLHSYSHQVQGIDISSQIGAFVKGYVYGDPTKQLPYTFQDFQQRLISYYSDANICNKLTKLVEGTGLENIPVYSIIAACEDKIKKVCTKCDHEINSLDTKIKSIASGITHTRTPNAALKRIEFALCSIWTKNMISYLAEEGFLPSSNIPNNVVSLEIDENNATKQFNQVDKTNPQRPLNLAINEYAPGKEVVINNVVYPIEGIRTDGDAMNGNSSIRYIAYCPNCQQVKIDNTMISQCPNCHSHLNPIKEYPSAPTKMIQPNGFITGKAFRAKKIDNYIQRIEPTLIGMQQWQNNAENIYRIKVSDSDHSKILFINKGNGYGFALCEYCGKMKPETVFYNPNATASKAPFENAHADIRTLKTCEIVKNKGTIKRNVLLSAEIPTDIAEIYISTDLTGKDKLCLLHTLGTILSRVFAQYLGIEDDEISYGTTPLDTLFIYDTTAGGAGYSTQLPTYIEKVLDECLVRLTNHKCEKACTKCLIDHRSNIYRNYLNKDLAIDWLKKEKNSRQDIPDSVLNLFPGETVRKVTKDIYTELFNRLNRVTEVSYFLDTDPTNEFMEDKLTPCFNKIMFAGNHVYPVVSTLKDLTFSQKLYLMTLEGRYGQLQKGQSIPAVDKPLLYVRDSNSSYFYFKSGEAYYYVIDTQNLSLISCAAPHIDPSNTSIFVNKVTQPRIGTNNYLDMILGQNAQNLTDFLISIATTRPVIVHYTDIYLASPGVCVIAGQLISTILQRFNLKPDKVIVSTSTVLDNKDDTWINGSFLSVTERNDYLENCINENLKQKGISLKDGAEVQSNGKLQHSRVLRICNSDFELEINPDGGLMQGWKFDWNVRTPYNSTGMTFDYNLTNTEIVHNNTIRYTVGWTKRN